jgi:hypothetical protein
MGKIKKIAVVVVLSIGFISSVFTLETTAGPTNPIGTDSVTNKGPTNPVNP